VAVVAAGAGYGVVAATGRSTASTTALATSPSPSASTPSPRPSGPPPRLTVDGLTPDAKGAVAVDWATPLRVTATHGTLTSVRATGPGGGALAGTLVDGVWTAGHTVVPGASYALTAHVRPTGAADADPDAVLAAQARTAPAGALLKATLREGDGQVMGVGEPASVFFNRSLTVAERRQVQQRLGVRAVPAVHGAWHWVDSTEVHYRPATYWKPGTKVHVDVDLTALRLAGTRTWGSGHHTSDFTIGDALVSTVDVARHTMTVRRNGRVLRVLPVSTGRDKYPTKGGVHLVLEKTADMVFDSATVGIPRDSPDGYLEHLPWSVRISYGGAFVHANPATVLDQGVVNVSHGCVNLSVADAHWYYDLARRGDVVDVVNALVGPDRHDPGMRDWNTSFAAWSAPERG
jgi:lipoprotein-anchoring transpeptidase ErfK/SrfK